MLFSTEENTDYVQETSEKESKSASKIMTEITRESDLVVLAESDVSNRDSFFNNIHGKIEKAVAGPILVVLREEES